MPLSTRAKLGPYEILAPIGAGGMGEVYKARDTQLDRLVATKSSMTEFSERFAREARAAAAPFRHQGRRERCKRDHPFVPPNKASSPMTVRLAGSGVGTSLKPAFSAFPAASRN